MLRAFALRAGGVLALLALWWAVAAAGIWPEVFVPAPSSVWQNRCTGGQREAVDPEDGTFEPRTGGTVSRESGWRSWYVNGGTRSVAMSAGGSYPLRWPPATYTTISDSSSYADLRGGGSFTVSTAHVPSVTACSGATAGSA